MVKESKQYGKVQNTKPKSPFLSLFSSFIPRGHNFFLVCDYYVSL